MHNSFPGYKLINPFEQKTDALYRKVSISDGIRGVKWARPSMKKFMLWAVPTR